MFLLKKYMRIGKRILDCPKVSADNQKAIADMFNNIVIKDKKILMCHGNSINYGSTIRTKYVTEQVLKNNQKLDYFELSDDMDMYVEKINLNIEHYDLVICWADIVAHKICKLAKLKGLSLPDDIEVVGFDGLLINNLFEYKLTTINQDIKQIGLSAINNLISLINEDTVGDIYIDATFVQGDTSK